MSKQYKLGNIYLDMTNCHSVDLMNFVNRHELYKQFECIPLNTMPPKQLLAITSIIKNLPAIVLMDMAGKPRETFEGEKAFVWIKQHVMSKREMAKINAENSRRLFQSANIKNNMQGGIFEYCPDEQNGISDTYALCNDDIALPKTFVNKDFSGESIMTIPIGNMNEYKKKESITKCFGDTDLLIRQLEETRKNQDKQTSTAFEENTVKIVLNSRK